MLGAASFGLLWREPAVNSAFQGAVRLGVRREWSKRSEVSSYRLNHPAQANAARITAMTTSHPATCPAHTQRVAQADAGPWLLMALRVVFGYVEVAMLPGCAANLVNGHFVPPPWRLPRQSSRKGCLLANFAYHEDSRNA